MPEWLKLVGLLNRPGVSVLRVSRVSGDTTGVGTPNGLGRIRTWCKLRVSVTAGMGLLVCSARPAPALTVGLDRLLRPGGQVFRWAQRSYVPDFSVAVL